MRNLIKILLIIVFIPFIGQSQTIYDKLGKAIHNKSKTEFSAAIVDYCTKYQPVDTNLIKTNDTLINIYQIYYEFYECLLFDTLSYSKYYDYLLIPQTIKMGFVKKIKTKRNSHHSYSLDPEYKFFSLIYRNDSTLKCSIQYIYNFRPKINTDKKVFYLDTILENTIQKLYLDQYLDTINTYENLKYFEIPEVWYNAGFDVGSAPHLDFILFNKSMTKSIFYYKFLGEQYAMILIKKKARWQKIFQEGFIAM